MNPPRSALLGTIWVLATSISTAQEGELPDVLMDCNYESPDSESTTLLASDASQLDGTRSPSVRVGGEQPRRALLSVAPGNFGECLYPNGHSVRVKVGVGEARPYGMCGGNPQVFLSLWVDKRKVDSSVWFAGHCIESTQLSYSIDRQGVRRCRSAGNDDAAGESTPPACDPLMAIDTLPLDEVEYPTKSQPAVGSIEIRSGDHAVCRATQSELTSHWSAFFEIGKPLSFDTPTFGAPSDNLAEPLARSRESEFDFDNDGKPDRVFLKEYMSNYMHGSTLFVSPELDSAANPTAGWFLPCQLDSRDLPLQQCPPFPKAISEAGFSMPDPGADPIQFRARYTHLLPFRYEGATYVAVLSWSGGTREFVAILKPLPRRSFERICLLRKVPENF